ncbi:MAG: cupin domain-containing protein [Paracoccaceae bacterium]
MQFHVIDIANDTPKSTGQRRLADLPDRVVSGDPHHNTEIQFTSPDGKLTVGTWTSTPGKWHAFTDKDEYCYIVSGHCALIHEDGTRREFRTGASFFIPDGFAGFWEVIETTTKHFVIRDTK